DLPVKLPQASTIETKEKNIAVTFAPDGRLAVNTTIVTNPDEFNSALRKELRADPNILVILRVDRGAAYLTLTDLIERCKKAGTHQIKIQPNLKLPEPVQPKLESKSRFKTNADAKLIEDKQISLKTIGTGAAPLSEKKLGTVTDRGSLKNDKGNFKISNSDSL